MTSPDPRLAALRAKAVYALQVSGQTARPANEMRDSITPALVIEILDALGSAEGRLAAAEGEAAAWRTKALDVEKHPVVVLLTAERDALAARLAGAERVVEAARNLRVMIPSRTVDGFGLHQLQDALDAYPSEAGGEGRGT